MGGNKRKNHELKPTGRVSCNVRRVELPDCLDDELDFSVFVDKLEGNYKSYRRIRASADVKDGDLIIPSIRDSCKNSQHESENRIQASWYRTQIVIRGESEC